MTINKQLLSIVQYGSECLGRYEGAEGEGCRSVMTQSSNSPSVCPHSPQCNVPIMQPVYIILFTAVVLWSSGSGNR